MKLEKMNYGKEKVHKIFLYGLISVVVLLLAVTFISSRANYKISSSVQLAKGKLNYKAPDLNVIGMYVNNGDGNYTELQKDEMIPKEGYTINQEKSYCYKTTSNEHDNNVKFSTNVLGEHIIENLSRNDKCYLYFDKISYEPKTMSELLDSHYKVKGTRNSETKDFNIPLEGETYGTIFTTEDDYGTSYYFAGAPLDNWVKFGKENGKDIWWRIIRINGNGSIRMIYTGTTAPTASQASVMTGVQTQIGTSTFNNKHDDNRYVGFYHASGQVHGYETPSTIYSNSTGDDDGTSLKGFYEKNIKGQSYEKWIDKNVGFCNDRQPSSSKIEVNNSGGLETNETYYAGFVRISPDFGAPSYMINPSLKCTYQGTTINSYKDSDLFTTSGSTDIGSTKGNKVLPYPIGLITADEVSYAGMVHGGFAKNNFLYTGQHYWSMTPSYFNGNSSTLYYVLETGALWGWTSNSVYGVRPVINLRSEVKLIGTGTYNNPYEVVT